MWFTLLIRSLKKSGNTFLGMTFDLSYSARHTSIWERNTVKPYRCMCQTCLRSRSHGGSSSVCIPCFCQILQNLQWALGHSNFFCLSQILKLAKMIGQTARIKVQVPRSKSFTTLSSLLFHSLSCLSQTLFVLCPSDFSAFFSWGMQHWAQQYSNQSICLNVPSSKNVCEPVVKATAAIFYLVDGNSVESTDFLIRFMFRDKNWPHDFNIFQKLLEVYQFLSCLFPRYPIGIDPGPQVDTK